MQDKPSRRVAPKPNKKSVNLSVDAALLAEAKAAGLNLSALLERSLSEDLMARRTAQWRQENRAAIESMNTYIDDHGLPLGKYRTW
jgi:antitoxin CcdA